MQLPAKTCNVRAIVLNPHTGKPRVKAKVTALLAGFDREGGFLAPSKVVAYTDANGHVTLPLWPNVRGIDGTYYEVTIGGRGVRTEYMKASVPDAPDVDLHEIVIVDTPEPRPDGLLVLEALNRIGAEVRQEAQGVLVHVDAIEQTAAEVAQAKTAAETARAQAAQAAGQVLATIDGAQQAAAAAQAAKTAAEAAQTGAQNVWDSVVEAADDLQVGIDAALAASQQATQAAQGVGQIKADAEAARDAAQQIANTVDGALVDLGVAVQQAQQHASTAQASAQEAAGVAVHLEQARQTVETATQAALDAGQAVQQTLDQAQDVLDNVGAVAQQVEQARDAAQETLAQVTDVVQRAQEAKTVAQQAATNTAADRQAVAQNAAQVAAAAQEAQGYVSLVENASSSAWASAEQAAERAAQAFASQAAANQSAQIAHTRASLAESMVNTLETRITNHTNTVAQLTYAAEESLQEAQSLNQTFTTRQQEVNTARDAAQTSANQAHQYMLAAQEAANNAGGGASNGGDVTFTGMRGEVFLDSIPPAGTNLDAIADWTPHFRTALQRSEGTIVLSPGRTYTLDTRLTISRTVQIRGDNSVIKLIGRTSQTVGQVGTYYQGEYLMHVDIADVGAMYKLKGVILDFGSMEPVKISRHYGSYIYVDNVVLEDVTLRNIHCNDPTNGATTFLTLVSCANFAYKNLRLENITARNIPDPNNPASPGAGYTRIGVTGTIAGISFTSRSNTSEARFRDTLRIYGDGLHCQRVGTLWSDDEFIPHGGNGITIQVGTACRVVAQHYRTSAVDVVNRVIKYNTYGPDSEIHIDGVMVESPWREEHKAKWSYAAMWSAISVQMGGRVTINNVHALGGFFGTLVDVSGVLPVYQGTLPDGKRAWNMAARGGEGTFTISNLTASNAYTKDARRGNTLGIHAMNLYKGELILDNVQVDDAFIGLSCDAVKTLRVNNSNIAGKVYAASFYAMESVNSTNSEFVKTGNSSDAAGSVGAIQLGGWVRQINMFGGAIRNRKNANVTGAFNIANSPLSATAHLSNNKWTEEMLRINMVGTELEVGDNLLCTTIPHGLGGQAPQAQKLAAVTNKVPRELNNQWLRNNFKGITAPSGGFNNTELYVI